MKNVKPLVYFFIFAAILLRVLRHYNIIGLPANFAPIAAMALFSGTYFLDRKQAFIVPLVAMIISDAFIGFYNPLIMLSVYLCFSISVLIGVYIKKNKSLTNVIGSSLLSSVIFYLITNFAVWGFGNWYPFTVSGLMQSYIMAIPFFKWTLLGDLFYVTVMFGSYELIFLLNKNIYKHQILNSKS